MIQAHEFYELWEKYCKNCVHNQGDYWCDKDAFNCNPKFALNFCKEDNFEMFEKKDD